MALLVHRGFVHSLTFAVALGALASLRFRWLDLVQRRRLAILLMVITASHGLLDMATNGGLGIAVFSPFDTRRYFFPWQPIEVSPIGLYLFLSRRGLDVLRSEWWWVIFPSLLIGAILFVTRRRSAVDSDGASDAAKSNPKGV